MPGLSIDRLRRLPNATKVAAFLGHLRYATRKSAVRAVIDGIVVTFTLKRRGVRPLLGAPHAGVTNDASHALRVSKAVDAGFGLLPVEATCLRRSVTLVRELNRLGLAAAVHVGVRNVDGKVEAHAWVQSGDLVLNDERDVTDTYIELAGGELERALQLLT